MLPDAMTTIPCKYVYCAGHLDSRDTSCTTCGYPVDTSKLTDPDFVKASLPDRLPRALIDMHQIVPTENGQWEFQLGMNKQLNIEHLLLQSVPGKVTSLANNEALRKLGEQHENVSISQFADPRIPFVRRKLRGYARAGVRVIKLLPCLGYEPDNPRFNGFWSELERQGLSVMTHTGFITARHKAEEKRAGVFLNSRFGRPIYFDRIARQFPELKIILCHMGGGAWYEEAAQMVTHHDNVWGDVAGPGIAALKPLLEQHVKLDWSRVFWGNDSPASCYGFNLRLLQICLQNADRLDLLEGLLYHHGRAFCEKAKMMQT